MWHVMSMGERMMSNLTNEISQEAPGVGLSSGTFQASQLNLLGTKYMHARTRGLPKTGKKGIFLTLSPLNPESLLLVHYTWLTQLHNLKLLRPKTYSCLIILVIWAANLDCLTYKLLA